MTTQAGGTAVNIVSNAIVMIICVGFVMLMAYDAAIQGII
jgi:hypothetical protein